MTATDGAAEPVGSMAEEAFKLFRAIAADKATGGSAEHVCTATWCPVCQVVGFVRDNPDALTKVSQSAAAFTRSLRDLIDSATTTPETP